LNQERKDARIIRIKRILLSNPANPKTLPFLVQTIQPVNSNILSILKSFLSWFKTIKPVNPNILSIQLSNSSQNPSFPGSILSHLKSILYFLISALGLNTNYYILTTIQTPFTPNSNPLQKGYERVMKGF